MSPLNQTATEYILEGNPIRAVEAGYFAVLGQWFYFLIALAVIIAIQYKTESAEATGLIMLIIGGVGFTWYFPAISGSTSMSVWGVWTIMMIIGITMIFYKWFERRE